jgi:hypothetical protein
VAFVPAHDPACRGPVTRGVASMEMRYAGARPLILVGEGAPCPIEALAQPLTPTATP